MGYRRLPQGFRSTSWKEHKDAKKDFARVIRRVTREYENNQMIEAVDRCTIYKAIFWQHLKKCRGAPGSNFLAIAKKNEPVVNEIKEILVVQ